MTGLEIRALRDALGMTQVGFARLFRPPVVAMTVSRWERGETHPGRWESARLNRLAKKAGYEHR